MLWQRGQGKSKSGIRESLQCGTFLSNVFSISHPISVNLVLTLSKHMDYTLICNRVQRHILFVASTTVTKLWTRRKAGYPHQQRYEMSPSTCLERTVNFKACSLNKVSYKTKVNLKMWLFFVSFFCYFVIFYSYIKSECMVITHESWRLYIYHLLGCDINFILPLERKN